MSRGGSRPHSGHRGHRRRWTGPTRSTDHPVRSARVLPLDTCRPGIACGWHGQCVECGDTIHLATVDVTPGFGRVDVAAIARVICGTPPLCADCREART